MQQRLSKNKIDFSSLTGRGVNVAVIDSGIDLGHPKVGSIAASVDISSVNGRIEYRDGKGDRAGHGTACAGIIRRKAPGAELFSIGIFDENLMTDSNSLIAAIEWAIDHRMHLINLSLGSTDGSVRDKLLAVCRRASATGIVLVAAEHNEGMESFPAIFPEVIGVTSGNVSGRYGYFYRPGATIECMARGDKQRLCWMGHSEIITDGTSFAAPHITGILALLKEARPQADLQEIRQLLLANASEEAPVAIGKVGCIDLLTKRVASAENTRESSDCGWIHKAALYPYTKEMHGFVRYLDLLPFKVVGIADPIGKGLVGKDAGIAIGVHEVNIKIKAKLADAMQEADTLVLGYVDELGRISKKDILRNSIQTALDQGKNVFSFLSVLPEQYGDLHIQATERGLKIHYPYLGQEEMMSFIHRDSTGYGPVDKPVLCVMGTRSQQGKFTLQLALRKALLDMDYKVGQFGTEHQSELFGMDYAFPMGYGSPMGDLPMQYFPVFIDAKMRQISSEKRPDIIIAGSQAGTIPYNVKEHALYMLTPMSFLLGIKPDACILVVNDTDTQDYIQDTIDVIRGLVKAPTIALAMSDQKLHLNKSYGRSRLIPKKMAPDAIKKRLLWLEDTFHLPAESIVSEDGIQRITQIVLQFFSETLPR